MGEDACAIGRGTYIKKKSDLQKKLPGQVRTAVPREGVYTAMIIVYYNTVKEYFH